MRGQIKKALARPEGAVRVTFEDRVLASDIIFLRAWVPVKPARFYNPVQSLLTSGASSGGAMMRTTAEIRRAEGIAVPTKAGSVYNADDTVREARHFSKLKVPARLEAALPFKAKQKTANARAERSLEASRAVVMSAKERTEHRVMQEMRTLRHDQNRKRKAASKARADKHQKKQADDAVAEAKRRKVKRKAEYKKQARQGRASEANVAIIN